jgi:hypothetical protein
MSIIAAAFLVSLLNCLGGTGAAQGMRRIVGGLILTLAVFRPLRTVELKLPRTEQFRTDAQAAVADGLEQANRMRESCITEGYTAYILNKAAAEGLDAQVHVEAGEEGYPETVTIHAQASPLQRQELTGDLVRELGIDKEAVEWIDPYQSSESTPSYEHTNIPS